MKTKLKFRKAKEDDKKEFIKMKNDFFEYFLKTTGEKRIYSNKRWKDEFNEIMKKKIQIFILYYLKKMLLVI